ncbi:hypothetical protein ACNVED_04195 [Legionella sp. D16C41]|uniref:hypothetical protein n=1 Tax=Legionella sp. D16C41 TaxID=3402688 RepID=UPI003AF9F5E7
MYPMENNKSLPQTQRYFIKTTIYFITGEPVPEAAYQTYFTKSKNKKFKNYVEINGALRKNTN